MKQLLSLLQKPLLRFVYLLGLMTVVRLFFSFYNASCFSDWGFLELVKGLRVDASFIAYVFCLYFVTLMIVYETRLFRVLRTVLFSLGVFLILIPEMVDLMYFEFVLKRMTSDVFAYLRSGGEFWQLLPQFLLDFWWIILSYLTLIVLLIWQEYKSNVVKSLQVKWVYRVAACLIWIGLTVLIGRGGLQKRPLELSNATQGVPSQNTGIVLNSGFSLFSSFFVDGLEKKDYFSPEELATLYSLEKQVVSSREANQKNVVILILESFSQEYTGFYNKTGVSYTPFFDSLLRQSYVYQNAYANGKRSVEALPAILAGLPSLMSTPYIFSTYAQNRITALPSVLRKKGYNTSFYHGGHNGTMGFDGFCSQAGIEKYYGMDEYGGDLSKDFDGNWGIFDEPYLQYFSQELTKKKEPFFSTLFTLSSHHPYTVPEKYSDKFEEGTLPIHRSVRYSDYALQKFFASAQKESWFKNTVFVLLADHTAQSESDVFGNAIGKYRIPIAIYEPKEVPFLDKMSVVQQTDVMSLVLERLGFNGVTKTFGNSSNQRDKAVAYNDNFYQVIKKDKILQFDGEGEFNVFSVSEGVLGNELKTSQEDQNELKAVIQKFSEVLIENTFR